MLVLSAFGSGCVLLIIVVVMFILSVLGLA